MSARGDLASLQMETRIIQGNVQKDHVLLVLEIPPNQSVSFVVSFLKGRSAIKIFERHTSFFQGIDSFQALVQPKRQELQGREKTRSQTPFSLFSK